MSNNKDHDCDYKLKLKYHGIPKTPGSRDLITNGNITNEIGYFLLKNHPRGEMLFDVYPENPTAPIEQPKGDSDMKLADLKAKYPEVAPANSKAKMLERIAEWKASQDTEEVTNDSTKEEEE